MSASDIIVAPATGQGNAALALVRVSGPGCHKIVTPALGRSTPPRFRRATHAEYRDRQGVILDDVLVTFFQAPASFTSEDLVELTCHGNPLIVKALCDDILARGARFAEPGEFTKRAFLHGRLDLAQAEAVGDIIAASSHAALEAARRHLDGTLSRRVSELNDRITGVRAQLEAYIDFPDEDLPPEDKEGPVRDLCEILAATRHLAQTHTAYESLHHGYRVVLLGPPNAGKSSLFNRILDRDRAITSEQPGTTRDFLEESIHIDGWTLRVTDTAGVWNSTDLVDIQSVNKSRAVAEQADRVLLVLDQAAPAPPWPDTFPHPSHLPHLFVLFNKTDQPRHPDLEAAWTKFPSLHVSATTGEGLPELQRHLSFWASSAAQSTDPEQVLVNARQEQAVRSTATALQRALQELKVSTAIELAVPELAAAQDCLAEVIGPTAQDAVLDQLFQRFCIGK